MDRINTLLKNTHVRSMLLCALLIVSMSWLRVYIAGTIKVDGHGLSGLPVYIVFFTFIGSLSVYALSLYKLWKDNAISSSQVRIMSYLLTGLFSFMLPMLSNDIFSLLLYGDAANHGVDVYTDVHAYGISPYYTWVSDLWKTAPCVYGPVSLGTSRLACMVGAGNVYLAIAMYKVLVFLWAVLFIEMIYHLSMTLQLSVRPLLFILLNPIFLIQGVAQLHCDLLAVALSASVLFFFFSRRWYIAFLFAGLALAAKMNFILVLGFLLGSMFFDRISLLSFFYKMIIGVILTFAVFFLLYYPYYTSPATFSVPLKFLFGQNPGKSLSEVLGDIFYFAPSVISGHREELNATMGKSSGVSEAQLVVWLAVKKACQIFAFILSLVIFIRFWLGDHSRTKWMKIFLRLLIVFLLFYSHVFYAWYLMILLPFVWFEQDERFIQWLFVLMAFSNIHDIMCAVNRGTGVYFMVLPLTLFGVLLFFWRFRNNFFTSLD